MTKKLVNCVAVDMSQAEIDALAALAARPVIVTSDEINAYRDQLINSGFEFGGVVYQTRPEDRENMAGAATLALAAITNGAAEGDYRWADVSSDFEWIAADNSTHKMDAQTMFAFGAAALAHKQAHIFAARELKDADPIPDDWQDPAYWP